MESKNDLSTPSIDIEDIKAHLADMAVEQMMLKKQNRVLTEEIERLQAALADKG